MFFSRLFSLWKPWFRPCYCALRLLTERTADFAVIRTHFANTTSWQWNLAVTLYTNQVKTSFLFWSSIYVLPVLLVDHTDILEPSDSELHHAPRGICGTPDKLPVQLVGHLLANGCTRVGNLPIHASVDKLTSALLKKNETLFYTNSKDSTPLANDHPRKSAFSLNVGRPMDWHYCHSARLDWFLLNHVQTLTDISTSVHGLDVLFSRLTHVFDKNSLIIMINALIFSKLFHCSSVWSNSATINLIRLQAVQTFSARIISNARKVDHVTPVREELFNTWPD